LERELVRYKLFQTMMLCVAGIFGPNFGWPFPARKPFSARKWTELRKFPYIEQEMGIVHRIVLERELFGINCSKL
jgi:hypothetical protein